MYVPKVDVLKSVQHSFYLQSLDMWGLTKTDLKTLTPLVSEALARGYTMSDFDAIFSRGFEIRSKPDQGIF